MKIKNNKKVKEKRVYISLSVDVLHHGHINLIYKAKKYGKLIVGLLTDKAILEKKRLPLISYDNRKKILENISGVEKIVPQNEWSYVNNIKHYNYIFLIKHQSINHTIISYNL